MISAAGQSLLRILEADGRGRESALPAPILASRVGLSVREVQTLALELIDSGIVLGSSCVPGRHGLFLCQDLADLEAGTRHIVSRAVNSLRRVRTLKRAAQEQFGPQALRLFDLEEAS